MQHVSSLLHHPDVKRSGVPALAVGDGVVKAVAELLAAAQQVGLHKAHHGVVWGEGGGGGGNAMTDKRTCTRHGTTV